MARQDTKLVKGSTNLPARVAADRVIGKLREAEKALQYATTVHQAKLVSDVAAAQEVFAHRQRLGDEITGYAHEIKTYALAKLGELLRDMPKATGGTHGGRPKELGSNNEPSYQDQRVRCLDCRSVYVLGEGHICQQSKPRPSTLAELGIDKKTAMVAQQLAALPEQTRDAIAKKETTLAQAKRDEHRKTTRAVELPDGKYRVLYADPPWFYGNSGVINESDGYGRAARHYPSMTIAELCAMEVLARVADNAVLFMWVTSPLLDECWPVIKAWGFTYKTSMVWDKVDHNYGSYVSVRHELLLICTRGSCTPDNPTPMPDSVMSIARSDVHSQKPEEFRAVIDRLYNGDASHKLELFGRRPVAGWTQFGNELNEEKAS